MAAAVPRVGDVIYVDDTDVVHQTYLRGGWATVREVRNEQGKHVLWVEEAPGATWTWEYLAPIQEELRAAYGSIRAGKYILRPQDARDE
jgi:hypothetical protein